MYEEYLLQSIAREAWKLQDRQVLRDVMKETQGLKNDLSKMNVLTSLAYSAAKLKDIEILGEVYKLGKSLKEDKNFLNLHLIIGFALCGKWTQSYALAKELSSEYDKISALTSMVLIRNVSNGSSTKDSLQNNFIIEQIPEMMQMQR